MALTDLQYNDTQGSTDLLAATAKFLNAYFKPTYSLTSSNILAGNGVTAILDALAFNVADEGDSILLPTPSYGMFAHDLITRNGIDLVHVPCDDINEGRFNNEHDNGGGLAPLTVRLDTALKREQSAGRRVAAVLLANPENPLGRCYSRAVLSQVADLCSQHQVHLIVDEIYAISGGSSFTSILSVVGEQSKKNVHVLWGMSKVRKWLFPKVSASY
ncbi:hypothetical protein ACHAPT_011269 [Fusarium lateritium]